MKIISNEHIKPHAIMLLRTISGLISKKQLNNLTKRSSGEHDVFVTSNDFIVIRVNGLSILTTLTDYSDSPLAYANTVETLTLTKQGYHVAEVALQVTREFLIKESPVGLEAHVGIGVGGEVLPLTKEAAECFILKLAPEEISREAQVNIDLLLG